MRRIRDYLIDHWRGELSLVQSYWVNGFFLTVVIITTLTLILPAFDFFSIKETILFSFLILIIVTIVAVWQYVGIWRSANNHTDRTRRYFWPAVAKLTVILGVIRSVFDVSTTSIDLLKTAQFLREPWIAEYSLERVGSTDLQFTGAINDDSVREIIRAFKDPSVEFLRVDSFGGLNDSAVELGIHIRDNGIAVIAEGQCISACVILLAASPETYLIPGTEVTFHRAEALVEYSNPDMQKASEQGLMEADRALIGFGIPQWAIDKADREEFWTPSLGELVQMGLIEYVYDFSRFEFVPADNYCLAHPAECGT